MKKYLTFLLAAVMVFALVACGGTGKGSSSGAMEVDDYVLKYNGFELLETYEGEKVIALDYSVTNNGKSSNSFIVSLGQELNQGSEALEITTVFTDYETFATMSDAIWETLEPGKTLDVTLTYELKDYETPVEIKFSGWNGESAKHTVEIAGTQVTKLEDPYDGIGYVDGLDWGENSGLDEDFDWDADLDWDETDDVEVEEAVSLDGEWNDQWYGWWMILEPTGDYEDYDGYYFDCCAAFEPTEDGYTLLSIWDEVYTNYENDCLAEIYLDVEGDNGTAAGGYFLSCEPEVGTPIVDRAFSEYEDTIFFTVNVEDEYGTYVASVFLTKWGEEWNEDFGDYPTYYESYFLPKMQSGEALPKDISDIA